VSAISLHIHRLDAIMHIHKTLSNILLIYFFRCAYYASMSTLLKSIRRAKHTQASLARELKVSPQRVNNWVMRGIPPHWAPRVAQILGTTQRNLCPDFPWPK
jgi:hypothetical protein